MQTLSLGTQVKRIGSEQDSSTGRTGEIVEINNLTQRYRVRWTLERSGRPVNTKNPEAGTRTWVAFRSVQEVKA
jgi:hypothetical protein